ncbi:MULTISPECIES: HlyD family secretion protein [Cellulophaga]|uniref:Biotin attachment protein n=1 Tax=Cellulophaga baltica 18 TaxID=1348584 RepID=A0AAU8RSN2_9FLAO|nr:MULTISPECIES: biotin/lipoyl-binding protein [Cellulophaga]WFO15376.1 HlyD family secretion protein [Cellulophaga baltica 4]AIY12285.1 biotin attachment protein [Cellulophaga baltica NN016038]AIZ40650.1 biotin attachment protein [Cellulophaga baltica 18]KGK29243.1 biotin attachment protein [Cellulophaga sp. E6(2014)]MBA6315361.1 biotin/lipoyl-binding protein [Cellulophaga baltica]
MLNISNNVLNKKVDLGIYKATRRVFHKRHYKYFNRFLIGSALFGVIVLFLPWTQNVRGKGSLTSLRPDQRPQTIQSPIPGRIEKWFVQEGDFVHKGDTILFISEIKNEYFDPKLVERTGDQIKAKEMSVVSYEGKVKALNNQIGALATERGLKLQQAKNKLLQSKLKVQSDSIDLMAATTNLEIAERQYNRTVQLQEEGLKAVTDVETKRLKLQETQAKLISQENKLLASRNEILNASVEVSRVQAEYTDKISKAQSDMYTAQSGQYDSQAQVTKLENQFTNYEMRNDMYYIKAPQSGYINKAIKAGIGETFKEGDKLVGIMPSVYDKAVEMFIEPLDLPLIHRGEKVRIEFDGWPAIVFSGWPNASYGTYGGTVVAVETFISPNGKYRVLLAQDPEDQAWPDEIRVGSGASTIALLEDVPIWYELWRQLNGFPPNYYQPTSETTKDKK